MPVQIGAPTISGGSSTAVAESLSRWAAEKRQAQATENLANAREEGLATEFEEVDGKKVLPEEKKPLLGFIGSKTVEQYNKGVRDAYILDIDRDNTLDVNRIAQESNGDIGRFNDVMEKHRSTVVANVDPLAANVIGQSLDRMIGRARNSVQELGIKQQVKASTDKLNLAIMTFEDQGATDASNGDIEGAAENIQKLRGALDSLIDTNAITESEATLRFDKASRRITATESKSGVYALAESDTVEAFKEIDRLQNDKPDIFTPEQWDGVIGEMMGGVNEIATINAAKEANVTINQKAEVSNIEISARTGLGDSDQLMTRTNELFFDGTITAEKRTSIMTSLINRQQDAKQKAADFTGVANRLDGDSSIVLDNKTIDAFYTEKYEPMLEDLSREGQTKEGLKATYVDKMKYMPAAMKAEISTYLNSDSIELITSAATLIDKIDDVEGVTDQFGVHERALASTVVDLLANMDPKEAVHKARELTDPSNQPRVIARTATLKEFAKGGHLKYDNHVKDAFNSWWNDVNVTDDNVDQMSKEYRDIFESHYKAGMNMAGAHNKASQLMSRNWGGFQGRAMKHPPGKFYAVAGSEDYIQKDLNRFVQKNSIGVDYKEALLFSDEITDRTASKGNPAYRVMLSTDDGLIPLIAGKTGVGHWAPDKEAELNRVNSEKEASLKSQRERLLTPKSRSELRHGRNINALD